MSVDWKQRPEGGGRFAMWLLRTIARHGGRPVARVLLYPITLYFLFRRGPERRASIAFLDRALGRPATLADGARHVHTFASTILDRLFLLDGEERRFRIDVHGVEALAPKVDEGRGVLLFGSHLGSFDALRALGRQRPDLKLRVLLDRGHNAAITELLAELDPGLAAGIIDAGQGGPAVVLAIQQALQEGAMVALLVDRARPGETALAAPLLGTPAPFPTAPWLIASVLKAPVMLAFGLYRGGNRYDLLFEPFATAVDVPRAQRAEALSALVHRYAGRLEHHLRGAPWNWFNFYDFWHSQASLPAPPDGSGAAGRLDQRAGDGGRR